MDCQLYYIFFEVRYRQPWLIGFAGCTVFSRFWVMNICNTFGQQFLVGQGMM